jgi:flagellar L-ring protein precursor FlgH
MMKRIASLMIIPLLVTGCETINPPRPGVDPMFAPTYPMPRTGKMPRYSGGAVFNDATAISLFETNRARHVGDILTVLLVERTDAQKRAQTTGKKDDKIEMPNPLLYGRKPALGAGYDLGINIETKRKFDGQGESRQNNRLDGNISVTVAKVLANGNLVVQGEKWIRINQGNEFVRLVGIVRPFDIKPDNTIESSRIANARIAYSGTGQVSNTNAQGWFSRILWGPIYPY